MCSLTPNFQVQREGWGEGQARGRAPPRRCDSAGSTVGRVTGHCGGFTVRSVTPPIPERDAPPAWKAASQRQATVTTAQQLNTVSSLLTGKTAVHCFNVFL